MNQFFKGFKQTAFSAYGAGALVAFLAVMVVLYWVDLDPAAIAQRLKNKLEG